MIHIYSSSSNLGDNLGYTALGALTPTTVHMYDDAGCRAVSPVFQGVCEVVHDNGYPGGPGPKSNDPTTIDAPTTKRHLVAVGLPHVPAIPVMRFTEEELAEARQFVSQFKNPCIIKLSPQVTDDRTPPIELFEQLIAQNPDVTFLSFGLSKNHAKHNFASVALPEIKTFFDWDIRKQAAAYAVVGRYAGPDTGDYHLMLAAGGTCDVLVPDQTTTYRYQFFHYGPECWLDAPVRVRYHQWTRPLGQFITGLNVMIRASLDHGYAYDLLSINEVKIRKNPGVASHETNFRRLYLELESQVGDLLHSEIMLSAEYKALSEVNEGIFDLIERNKEKKKRGEQIEDVDPMNYSRFERKRALQERFFPRAAFSERKIGYT